MYPIDHVPVAHADLNELADVFEALGFAVSDVVSYTSPDDPSGPWTCRAVFLREGWLDLQWQPGRSTALGAAPHSCLFRVPGLDRARRDLEGLRMGPSLRLEGRWEKARSPDFALAWMALRERVAPLVLGLAEYPGLHPNKPAAAAAHPNTAVRVLGLAFGGVQAGPSAGLLADRLSLSGFRYLEEGQFMDFFGEPKGLMSAIRVQVQSLPAVAEALDHGGLNFREATSSICVPVQARLGCGLEFTLA